MRLSVLDLVPVRTDQSTVGCAGCVDEPGADRGPPRLHPLLDRRASQHARGGGDQPAGDHRPSGRAHHAAAAGLGWRHVAQPCAAGRRRAVRAAGGRAPGAYRPRHRPGARLRPGDVVGTARCRRSRRSRYRGVPGVSRRRRRADERAGCAGADPEPALRPQGHPGRGDRAEAVAARLVDVLRAPGRREGICRMCSRTTSPVRARRRRWRCIGRSSGRAIWRPNR